MDPLLQHFVARVHSHYFSGFPIYRTGGLDYAGEFMKHRIRSRFLPQERRRLLAVPLCSDPTGAPLPLEALTRLCRASDTAVVLDRFVRTIHLLNLMRDDPAIPADCDTVFLPVGIALIHGVPGDHGKVFRTILTRLGWQRYRLGILLPEALSREPARWRTVARAYRANGFAVACHAPGDPLTLLDACLAA